MVSVASLLKDDVGHEPAIEECFDAEVEVGLRAGNRGAQVSIGVTGVDDGRVVAVDLDHGRSAGGRGGGILRHGS